MTRRRRNSLAETDLRHTQTQTSQTLENDLDVGELWLCPDETGRRVVRYVQTSPTHRPGALRGLLISDTSSYLLLVAMPEATSSFLLLVARPGAPSSYLLLVGPVRRVLAPFVAMPFVTFVAPLDRPSEPDLRTERPKRIASGAKHRAQRARERQSGPGGSETELMVNE